jgi:hypothetical protein
MTVLQVIQRTALRVGLEVPSVFFTNQTRTWQEMQVLVNDCAKQILDEYDWQALKKVHTITGDGVAEDFPMPDDYDRMVRDAHFWTNFMPFWNAQNVGSVDSWLAMESANFFAMVVPMWIISAADTLKFFYISNYVVKNSPAAAGTAAEFTADTQSFVLDERLLTHCLVYNWKQAKGLDYSADLQQYQDDMAYAIGKDKGPRIITEGRSSRLGNWQGGWPFSGQWS